MDTAEASGKTVENALSRALTQLGANRDEVEFEVIDEGQKGGLFGRGARDAVVRVTRMAESARPEPAAELPDTRIPRSQPSGGDSRRGGGGGQQRGGGRGPQGGGQPRGRSGDGGGRMRSTRTGFEEPQPKLREEDFTRPRFDGEAPAPAPAGTGNGDGSRGGRPRNDRPRGDRPDQPPRVESPDQPPRERAERPDRPERPERERRDRRRENEEHFDPDINAPEVDLAAHVVDDILQILEIDADITIREPLSPGEGLGSAFAVIDIGGDDLGLLIGRRGDTLAALQYLTNLVVNRQFPGRPGVNIDVEHYRHRREEQIVSLTRRMADRVRTSGTAITLEPMSPNERRIVHVTLADDPELATNSYGEGENRKVVISHR